VKKKSRWTNEIRVTEESEGENKNEGRSKREGKKRKKLKTKEICLSETSVNFQQTTQNYTQEDGTLQFLLQFSGIEIQSGLLA
jgi:hypothetical protein